MSGTEASNQDGLSLDGLTGRVDDLNLRADNLRTDLTTLNSNIVATKLFHVVNADRETNRVNTFQGNVNTLGDRVTHVEGTVAPTADALQNIVQAITTFGSSVNAAPGPARNLLEKFKETKKTLIKERDEVIDGYEKAVSRLDPIHYAAVTVLVVLIAFNVWFYTHMPDAGKKMMPVEFGSRLGLIGLVTLILGGFMKLLFDKLGHIRRQFHESRTRFEELCSILERLSETPLQRQQRLDAAAARGEVEIQIADKIAANYYELPIENLIPDFEVTRLRISNLQNKPPMSTVYLWGIVAIVVVSAAFMIALSIWDMLINGPPAPPAPSPSWHHSL